MPYLGKQRGLFSRVSEGVNLPADLGPGTAAEYIIKQPEAVSVLVDNVDIVSGGLIIHGPPTQNKLQATWKKCII